MRLLNASTDALVMDTLLYTMIATIIIFVLIGYMVVKKNRKAINEMGSFKEQPKRHGQTLGIILVISAVVIYALKIGLESNAGMLHTLMFVALPYVAIGIFIVGSVYRYTKRGYQVSSLSTQFLEGKQLFFGSQPFHWGLMFLFFGHLIAFLFPSALLAWNGMPVRLLILEISSFVFGLSALLGLVLLIKRRLSSKRLLVVANKMDMMVYIILLVQIVSGLSVAFFARWGSSWFASALTPYLRSVVSFNPEMDVVSAMPWYVQLHIISAFLIIAIIPFSRFMHFLVAPIDYLWRNYQLVIWNWNRKEIRNSSRHTFGHKSKNH